MVTLVLNSPRVDRQRLHRLAKTSVLIGVDGGLASIVKAGLIPDWVLGDFDSVEPGLLQKMPPATKVLRVPREKNYTDFELGLRLARVFRPHRISVLGLDGGNRLDHQIVNCVMLCSLALSGCLIEAWSGVQRMIFTAGTSILPCRLGRNFSVFALAGVAQVSILGGKYSAAKIKLRPGSGLGLGNEIVKKQALVQVEKGAVVISQWLE